MENRVIFDKMGLQLGTLHSSVNGRAFDTAGITGYALSKQQDYREDGLIVSATVFSIMAIVFLIPVVEEIVKPKFMFVVAVGVFLAFVSMQDFLKIKNPGDVRLMLLTDYGARLGLQTTSTSVLNEATVALESLGIHKPEDQVSPLRMKTTASGTSSVS